MDTTGRETTDRGLSPVVGIVLLIGLVFLGASLIAVTGMGVLDGLGSDAKTEHALSSARVAEHEIATAGYSGQTREIPFDDVAVVRDGHVVDGDVAVTWYNASNEDPADANDDCKSSVEGIGALEYTVGDRTIAYQSGGIWQWTDDETRVHSPPDLDFDGESLTLGLVKVDEGQIDGSSVVAAPDWDQSRNIAEKIRAASDCRPKAEDVHFEITSEYHDGWYQHVRSAFDDASDDNVTVTHHPEDQRVEVVIEGLDPMDPATFVVAEDEGIVGSGDQAVTYGNKIRIRTAITNRGDYEDTKEVSLNIVGTNVTNPRNHKVKIPAGETEETTLEIPYGQYKEKNKDRGLEPNKKYEYTIETEDDETDTVGSFYLGRTDTEFRLSNASVTADDDSRVLAADLRNVGVEESETEVKLALTYHGDDGTTEYANDTMTVTRGFGQEERVTWRVNESRLLQGENEFSIMASVAASTRAQTRSPRRSTLLAQASIPATPSSSSTTTRR